MTPGYSTDREPGVYIKNVYPGVNKAGVSTSFHHDSVHPNVNKSMHTTVAPPLHQIKTNTIEADHQTRNKYTGIKLISSGGTSSTKAREAGKHV